MASNNQSCELIWTDRDYNHFNENLLIRINQTGKRIEQMFEDCLQFTNVLSSFDLSILLHSSTTNSGIIFMLA